VSVACNNIHDAEARITTSLPRDQTEQKLGLVGRDVA